MIPFLLFFIHLISFAITSFSFDSDSAFVLVVVGGGLNANIEMAPFKNDGKVYVDERIRPVFIPTKAPAGHMLINNMHAILRLFLDDYQTHRKIRRVIERMVQTDNFFAWRGKVGGGDVEHLGTTTKEIQITV
eukprot:GHVS01023090.1.p1 GENE.GHVS01023090.1~~GHVS01023090.1.p1  ORF type:complete len:133 (-),score=16.44 GHVS01023090.1:66-464(-)